MSPLEWLASQKTPAGVQIDANRRVGQTGSNVGPNSDPEDPNTWPAGVKPAPDFGYLDPNGMWIPTPFETRSGRSWTSVGGPPKGSPAFLKLQKMRDKNAFLNGSLIELTKIVPLPGGAPEIPGYKRVDPGQFSTATGAQIGPSTIQWAYAYKSNSALNRNIILISPNLYYNTKISIGRAYSSWTRRGIQNNNGGQPVSSSNGKVYADVRCFNVDDMVLAVTVNSTDRNVGINILNSLPESGSLTPTKG